MIVLFDVDGTIVEAGQHILESMVDKINKLKLSHEIGIVGGGNLNRILNQLGSVYFNHYFTECGCLYYKNLSIDGLDLKEIHRKDIRLHPLYPKINSLIKLALKYLSDVDYLVTGNFIDLRCGIIYVSLIGLAANQEERRYFIEIDKLKGYKYDLLHKLRDKAKTIGIFESVDIVVGGSVGIGIYPKEWDKVQVVDYLKGDICYFGDRYKPDGNDHRLLNHLRVKGFSINTTEDTLRILEKEFHV